MKQNVDSSFKAFKENTGLGFTKLTIPLIVCVCFGQLLLHVTVDLIKRLLDLINVMTTKHILNCFVFQA